MIVMLLGDTHGDRGFTLSAIRWAADNGVDRIIQVGDFGFWPRTNAGQKFLHDVGKASAQAHVPLYFIDGNHEDHLYLQTLRDREPDQDMINYGKYPITYINRGTRWEWGGMVFGAFGGAYSIDRSQRFEDSGSYGWFRDEMPDPDRIEALGQVDVLITHDSPIVPPMMYASGGFKTDEMSTLSQRTVYDALLRSKAKLLVHGHWHLNERYNVAGVTIQALDMNAAPLPYSSVVIDTGTKTMYTFNEWAYRDLTDTTET